MQERKNNIENRHILTGVERTFLPDEIVVSKTNLKGQITYANKIFLQLAGYSEERLIGAPHSIIRHPAMPRGVFRLLWDKLATKDEVFAFVLNRSMNGDHYWVLAHVTPTLDAQGGVTGYHSNRRVVDKKILESFIQPLYTTMLANEHKHANAVAAADAGKATLESILQQKGLSYDEFLFSLVR